MPRVLLFDLDETLLVEEASVVASLEATARHAAAPYPDVDSQRLARDARTRARELWYATPSHPYCARIGLSSWEGLWCVFQADEPNTRWLREYAPTYRREAWRLALADQGVDDAELGAELGERFGVERRTRYEVFPDAEDTLRAVSATHTLGLVTNGASCLQREKLAASGLGGYFEVVVAAGDVGAGKPDAAMFREALARLGAAAHDTTMVGDNLERDIDGALDAGLRAVWLNRDGAARPPARPDLVEISTLAELPALCQGDSRRRGGG